MTTELSTERLAEAVTGWLGARCSTFHPDCVCCQAWAEIEAIKLINRGIAPNGEPLRSAVVDDAAVERALRAFYHDAPEVLHPSSSALEDDLGRWTSDMRAALTAAALVPDHVAEAGKVELRYNGEGYSVVSPASGKVEPVAWRWKDWYPADVPFERKRWNYSEQGPDEDSKECLWDSLVLLSHLQAAEAERDEARLECRNYMRIFDAAQARAEAAEAEVSKLKAQVETARVALEPFATSYMAGVIDTVADAADVHLTADFGDDLLEDYLEIGAFRAAAEALRALDEVNDGQ